nr:hypothetical protein Q903MT_gene1448 [Picea sitchensis]
MCLFINTSRFSVACSYRNDINWESHPPMHLSYWTILEPCLLVTRSAIAQFDSPPARLIERVSVHQYKTWLFLPRPAPVSARARSVCFLPVPPSMHADREAVNKLLIRL